MPRTLATTAALLVALLATGVASAAALDGFSEAQLASALRGALDEGTARAVAKLGKPDGYLADPKVRIPLPPALAKSERVLKALGLGKETQALVVAMNRAAEAAVPEAKAVVLDAVKRMTVADARAILGGPDDAAIAYFERKTRVPLTEKLTPIVQRATGQVKLAQASSALLAKAARYRLIDPKAADLDAWVTRRALDGLYLTIAEQERALRQDPLGQSSRLLRDVFGALRR